MKADNNESAMAATKGEANIIISMIGTPILKSSEPRALFPGIRKRPSIRQRRRSNAFPSCGPTMEFVGFLLGIFVVMGLNLYIFDLRRNAATRTGSDSSHRSLRSSGNSFPGTDYAWMQQTMSKDSLGLRKLQQEMKVQEERQGKEDTILHLGDNLAAHMDIP